MENIKSFQLMKLTLTLPFPEGPVFSMEPVQQIIAQRSEFMWSLFGREMPNYREVTLMRIYQEQIGEIDSFFRPSGIECFSNSNTEKVKQFVLSAWH